jgi:ABC-type multidrug transport system fused ATPase/permease subunit
VIDLFKSLNIVLTGDRKKFFLTSAILIVVVLIEIFGLGLISFLIINISNLPKAISNVSFFNLIFSFFSPSPENILIIFSTIIVLYSIISIILSSVAINKTSIFAQALGARIKSRIAYYFLHLEWIKIVGTRSSVNISRVINDGAEVGNMINILMLLLSRLVLTVVIVFLLFAFNPVFTFYIFCILSFSYIAIFFLFRPRVLKNAIRGSQYMDRSLNIITNMFGSMKEIIFFGSQRKVLSNLDKTHLDLAYVQGNNLALSQIPRFLIDSLILIILVIGIATLTSGVGDDLTNFFTTASIYGIAALKLLPAAQQIFYYSNEINSRIPYLSNVTELLVKNAHFENIETEEVIFSREILFKNVSFSWDGSESKSLLNLKIKKGEKIAVLGPTGSGKSTFIDLLLGLLEPESGEIYMDGIKINRKNMQSYRNIFAFVPQKIFFLEDSIRENILFGSKSELTENNPLDRIMQELKFDLIIKDNKSLDSNLSDSNQTVSGGQKQVIGIARALYRGGDILVLDEATNAMDKKIEKSIFEAIPNFGFSNLVCITHSTNMLKEFDTIYVFNNGVIEDYGAYEALKERNDFLLSLLKEKQ